eukprot:UN00042
MSSLLALDELIDSIDNNNNQSNRKGNAQSTAASKFKWKEIDKNVDRTLLRKLQKYKVINPDDISDREKSPKMDDILCKFREHNAKNGNKYKLVLLVRHGEGMHNWAKWELFGPDEWQKNQSTNLKWKDPHLTKLGVVQAKELLPQLHCLQSHVDLIVSSPLNRALETATYAFLPFMELNNSDNELNEVNEEKQSDSELS